MKSLKVVRTSDWLADVCILSRAWARCSLSICETVEMELKESRRDLKSSWEAIEGDRTDLVGVLGSMAGFVARSLGEGAHELVITRHSRYRLS